MQSIASDAIGGFNAFVETQRREPGEARLSLVLFDDQYEVPIKSVPLEQVEPLTDRTFVPRGSTALLDAIGRTLRKMTEAFAARPEDKRPDLVVVGILTDGLENSSTDFTLAHVADLIAARRVAGWQFVFLAANQDAIASAGRMNIPAADAANFAHSGKGVRDAAVLLSSSVTRRRRNPPG